MDADGVVRVGGTRVTLDTIVAAFKEGATAEEIVYQYPSLYLADVYSVLSYYLQRRADVETYLRQRQRQAADVRERNEDRFDPRGTRNRLLARRARQQVARYEETARYVAAGC
ncbi:MAG: DUF433 domain-containing protein [Chloroflexota bacterium]|nr:DUF433 domain-containing protein [Chloroflexota bacterium]